MVLGSKSSRVVGARRLAYVHDTGCRVRPAWIQAFGVTAGFAGIYLQQQKTGRTPKKTGLKSLKLKKFKLDSFR